MRVYKYPFRLEQLSAQLDVAMPQGSRLLSAGNQRETLCLWALVQTTRAGYPQELRRIGIIGTGHDCELNAAAHFLGTVLFQEGALVLHVFDLGVVSESEK